MRRGPRLHDARAEGALRIDRVEARDAQEARAEAQAPGHPLHGMEEWELGRAKLPYDAAKTRLRRMREAIGANPRKKNLK